MSGEAFDRAYMREMVTGHQMMLDMFRKESQNGSDADVKAWAAKMVPSIQEHLNMAQTASRTAVGTSGRAPSNGSGSGSPGTRGAIGGSNKPDKSGQAIQIRVARTRLVVRQIAALGRACPPHVWVPIEMEPDVSACSQAHVLAMTGCA
jgi:hypothetical protein